MNNTTESLAVGSENDVQSRKLRVTRTFILITLASTTYLGNTLILVSLKKFSKYLKGTPFILMGNLAVADLLLAIGLSLEVLGTIFLSLEINTFFCVVKVIVTGVSLGTSGKLLIFISFDRFCAIMFPMKHLTHSQKSRCRTIHIAIVWIISVLFVLIPAFVNLRSSKVLEDCNFGKMIPDGM
ncbi:olfactory receptor 4F6-like, partial [Ruditapes philippinarum]|uniref:olfactory receptor 4F6-like n=1 Tax=Ruditapes philippinarum TaxID=129788 RepID=UPI00295C1BB4